MKGKLIVFLALTACLSITVGAAFAHHGAALSFDMSKEITVKGTVTKFNWANPHSQIYFDATDSSGNVAHWAVEMDSPGVLWRTGDWARNTLKPGDVITVIMHPSKSGATVGDCEWVLLPDGRKLKNNTGTAAGDATRN